MKLVALTFVAIFVASTVSAHFIDLQRLRIDGDWGAFAIFDSYLAVLDGLNNFGRELFCAFGDSLCAGFDFLDNLHRQFDALVCSYFNLDQCKFVEQLM